MNSKDHFLFELYTEEIPASYQEKAILKSKQKLTALLDEYLIEYLSIETGGTANRLFFYISNLNRKQKSKIEEIKGPHRKICFDKNQIPTAALKGFAQKVGVKPEKILFKEIKNIEYAFWKVKKGKQNTISLLPDILEKTILEIQFERSMRWGNKEIRYARPIIQYFSLYGNQRVIFKGEKNNLWANIKRGNSIIQNLMSGKRILLASASDYFSKLKAAKIEVRPQKRMHLILKQIHKEASKLKLDASIDEKVLREVNFLVESPRVIIGEFLREFLKLPEMVIISEMQQHQRYFPLKNKKGNLVEKFLFIANLHSNQKKAILNIRKGNERVLASRLSDGFFFFMEDQKKTLMDRVNGLKEIVYQEKMGSMFDKKERMKEIAKLFLKYSSSKNLTGIKNSSIERSSDLVKADLTTNLVYEFENLQGDIGSIYASIDQEPKEICDSIYEHYLPRFQGDQYPKSPLGILISLADKIDHLIVSFLLQKEPSATHDPLGVRRQSIYIIQIMIQNKIRLKMQDFLEDVILIYDRKKNDKIIHKIQNFLAARLAFIFEKQGFDKKLIKAVIFSKNEDIYEMHLKLSALKEIKDAEEFKNLMTVFIRMYNILDDLKPKNLKDIKTTLFEKEQEHKLYSLTRKFISLKKNEEEKKYKLFFSQLAASKPQVDSFFDHVMVMHENKNIRQNRLSLLSYCVNSIREVFDLEYLK